MLRFILFIFISCWVESVYSQSRIAGRVTGEDGKALTMVMVRAYDASDANLLVAYSKTNQQGVYVLMVGENKGKDIEIRFSSMGYSPVSKRVENKSATLDVQMKESTVKLREASVRAPTVRQHSDTLVYSVGNLKSKTDRNMEDVIRRIPGVQVDNNGRINYNGNPINRFYIEGVDMLDGRYTLATRNLRPDDIASVSVYERHQPVKLLQGMESSDRAALNLRLKKSRLIKPIGNALLGVGWGDGFRWNGDLFTMLVGSRRQHLIALKGNNFAQNYTSESSSFYDTGAYSFNPPQTLADNLFPERPFGSPSVPENRYLDNNSALGSVNNIFKLREGLTLSVNAGYSMADNEYSLASQTTYALADGSEVTVTDDNRSDFMQHQGWFGMKWERNDSLRYLLNTLNVKGLWRQGNYALSSKHVRQHNRQKAFDVTDYLEWMIRKGKRTMQVYSYFALANTPAGSMSATWLESDSAQSQQAEGLKFSMRHSTSLGWGLGKNGRGGSLKIGFVVDADYDRLELVGEAWPAEAGTSDTKQTLSTADGYTVRTSIGPSYEKYVRGFSVKVALPVSMYNLCYRNKTNNRKNSRHRPYLRPSIEVNIGRIMHTWLTLTADYEYKPSPLTLYISESVYTSYRQLTMLGSGMLTDRKDFRLNGGFFWNDALNGQNIRLSGGYTRSQAGQIHNTLIGEDGSLSTQVKTDNSLSHLWQAAASFYKNIYVSRLSFRLQGGISGSRSPMMRQNERTDTKAFSCQIVASAEQNYLDNRLSVALIGSWQRFTNRLGRLSSVCIDNYSSVARLSVRPFKYFEVYGQGEMKTGRSSVANIPVQWYVDGGIRYVMKKMEFSFNARNLLNERLYTNRYFNASDVTVYSCRLRSAECLFTVRFTL